MKPTPQLNSNQRSARSDRASLLEAKSPTVDYSYQVSAETVESSTAVAEAELSQLRTFRTISREFFGIEADREYLREALLFVSISFVAAWPLAVMLHQLTRWMISPPPGGIW